MILYLDASALVKRYVKEEGSDLVRSAMEEASSWAMCRVGYVETARAVSLAYGRDAVTQIDEDWPSFNVVEVDQDLTEKAAEIAFSSGLRSLDALHMASALTLPAQDLQVATWDVRLLDAARAAGLHTVPDG
ncbi:MAG TPA: type II toxin-antitoxin system VapC family toxin [Trueperaceae bacterium]|nr:type II toxin-antitoxin system VapC family toxin [Trueperaceae bacterium]